MAGEENSTRIFIVIIFTV